jgi:endogenous inhibitor of DNA gyrase (YacG/DUF329 family)
MMAYRPYCSQTCMHIAEDNREMGVESSTESKGSSS